MKRNFLNNFLSFFFGLAIVASFFIFKTSLQAQENEPLLPPLQTHPLPTTLEQWQPNEQDDYFSSLVSLPIGALVWTEFPIKIYLDKPENLEPNTASNLQFQKWASAVETAIQEWNNYLSLETVAQPETANILIKREFPPLNASFNLETKKIEIPRARTAQTSYKVKITETQPFTLIHQMTIQISPRLSETSLLSAARHELGHALGIWGHSPVETDTMYFSQVRDAPGISIRDINTLKKVYQQPTRLGWSIPNQ